MALLFRWVIFLLLDSNAEGYDWNTAVYQSNRRALSSFKFKIWPVDKFKNQILL
jgi:hypothetical protein